eukprot:10526146-Ditylum_brightwellii.AAC.1
MLSRVLEKGNVPKQGRPLFTSKELRIRCVRRAMRWKPDFMAQETQRQINAGLAYINRTSGWLSPFFLVKKKIHYDIMPDPLDLFRMTIDLKRVNLMSEEVVWSVPNLPLVVMRHLADAQFFDKLDSQERFSHWTDRGVLTPTRVPRGTIGSVAHYQSVIHLPLVVMRHLADAQFFDKLDSQEMFFHWTDRGVLTPTQVPRGAIGCVAHYQSVIQTLLGDQLYKNVLLWLDDLLVYAETEAELLEALREISLKCQRVGLKLHARKCELFQKEVVWCGRMISGAGVRDDPA